MTEVQAHPLRGSSRDAITHAQRALRGRGLQFVSQRVVVAAVAVMQKTTDRTQKSKCCGGKFFFRSRVSAPVVFLFHDLT
jgi:hypothetical protein